MAAEHSVTVQPAWCGVRRGRQSTRRRMSGIHLCPVHMQCGRGTDDQTGAIPSFRLRHTTSATWAGVQVRPRYKDPTDSAEDYSMQHTSTDPSDGTSAYGHPSCRICRQKRSLRRFRNLQNFPRPARHRTQDEHRHVDWGPIGSKYSSLCARYVCSEHTGDEQQKTEHLRPHEHFIYYRGLEGNLSQAAHITSDASSNQ